MVSNTKSKELTSFKHLLILRFSQLLDTRILTVCRVYDTALLFESAFLVRIFNLYYRVYLVLDLQFPDSLIPYLMSGLQYC